MTVARPPVSIVIPNWNRRDDLLACIDSLLRMDYPAFRVTVVDNGSTDQSIPAIRECHPSVEVIQAPSNLGFAGACNLGMERAMAAGASFVLVMNNDTVVDAAMLSELVDAGVRNPGVGILSPKILHYERPDDIWFAGGDRDPLTWAVVRKPRGPDDGRLDDPREVNFVTGCGMLIAAEVIRRIGLFDTAYFMYYEDSDYCVRASRAGFRLRYVPAARMWHRGSASSGGKGSPLNLYYRRRALLLFLRRNVTGIHGVALLALRSGGITLEILGELLQGRFDAAGMLWRGMVEGLGVGAGRDRRDG